MSQDAGQSFGHFGRRQGRTAPPAALLCLFLLACAAAQGQTPAGQAQQPRRDDAAPPPMRYLPEEARTRLAAARDLKARTKLSIELAEARLASADAHVAADRFDAATLELGVYEALVTDALGALKKAADTSKNKQRDLFKRVELALRSHVPHLETLRRSLPAQHAVHVQAALDFVRDARASALEAFFDDTVIPDRPAAKEPASERAGGGASAAQPGQLKKPEQR